MNQLRQTEYFLSRHITADQKEDALREVKILRDEFVQEHAKQIQEIIDERIQFIILPSHHPSKDNFVFAVITLSFYKFK